MKVIRCETQVNRYVAVFMFADRTTMLPLNSGSFRSLLDETRFINDSDIRNTLADCSGHAERHKGLF